MTQTPTDELLELLEEHQPICHPQTEADLIPSHKFYGLAPWWTVNQAACLLCNLPPIDAETVGVLAAIPDNTFLRRFLSMPRSGDSASKVTNYDKFSDYVAWQFPIERNTVVRLSNVRRKLATAVKDGGLNSTPDKKRSWERLLHPESVVSWALSQGIPLRPELVAGLSQRHAIDYLDLPDEPFPDAICFYGPFQEKCYEENLLKPKTLSSISNQSTTTPLQQKDATHRERHSIKSVDENKPSKKNQSTSPLKNKSPSTTTLAPKFQKLLQKGEQTRQNTVNLCIQAYFPDEEQRSHHLRLIEKVGHIHAHELDGMVNLPNQRLFLRKHRCLAVAVFLLLIGEKLSPKKTLENEIMKKYGVLRDDTPSHRTLRRWLNDEPTYKNTQNSVTLSS